MSAIVLEHPLLRFYRLPVGKKAVMAVTGLMLFGFVTAHLLGNLQVYAGPEKINAYGRLLRANAGLLWAARLGLLAAAVLHIVAAVQLALLKSAARPVGYAKKDDIASSYASRTMIWSGPIIGVFVVYHLMHLTFGNVHPAFAEGDVYHNVVTGFQVIPVSIFYILAMAMLGLHLVHGVWSMFQSLGVSHPRYTPLLKKFAAGSTAFLFLGNISIPIAVMTGVLR
jgi:succinate dehydrogenase cytochrome b subunit